MIAVIADDFTGAAEIGGLALSYGYKVAIITNFNNIPEVDILVVASDLRSLSAKDAASESKRITSELLKLNPTLIYKKIDSVLRGNIGVELEAQMSESKKDRALLIPANPILNRTIKNGIYYVDKKPLMESIFAKDNSFKTKSSNVVEIIKKRGLKNVHCISLNDILPDKGLIVGNTENKGDLNSWAQRFNGKTAPAGASGFFGAIISQNSNRESSYNTSELDKSSKSLFICGSNFPISKKVVKEAINKGYSVSTMPDEIYYNQNINQDLLHNWINEINEMFETQNQVIISVLQSPNENSIKSEDIKRTLGFIVKKVMKKVDINEILIEGGSTAQAVVKAMKFNTFLPFQAITPGVTRMQIENREGVFLTMKPGSYNWPESIWKFNKKINHKKINHE